MPGLCQFSDEEIKRIKRLKFNEGKSYSSIAQIINRDRSSDRLCTSRGVRRCLQRSNTSAKSNRVYKRKLGFAALAFIDDEVSVDGEISGRKIQKRLQEKLHVNVSVSLINRERRRMDEHSVRSDDYSRPHESRCTAAAAACHSRDSRFV